VNPLKQIQELLKPLDVNCAYVGHEGEPAEFKGVAMQNKGAVGPAIA